MSTAGGKAAVSAAADIRVRAAEIRTKALAARRALSVKERKAKSKTLAGLLEERTSDVGVQTPILCFYPLSDEPDLREWYERKLTEGRRLFFPVTDKENIAFFAVKELKGFREGAFSVMEPAERKQRFCGGKRYLCVTPGVAFDAAGHRIGFGKGYYDRFFAAYPDGIKLGVAFREQLFASVPQAATDVPLDAVLFA